MRNFQQITHLDVQVHSSAVPELESRTTMLLRLYLECKYSMSITCNPT
jgi:hypothetical protein